MNTRQLPYFIAIAETKSLSAASKKLGVSQPALSKYLRELEKEISCPLFYRIKKKLYLTEAGEIYLSTARRIQEIQVQIRHGIYGLEHPERTVIRVGLSPARGAEILAAIYPELIRRFPDVEVIPVEGHSGDVLGAVRRGEADLSFGAVTEPADGLRMIPIHKEEIVLCVPAFHRLAPLGSRDVNEAPRIGLEEFMDSPFVQVDPSTVVGQVTEEILQQTGFQPVTVFRSVNVQLVYRIICTGAGVGLIPWYLAAGDREVVYFRLKEPAYLTGGLVARKDHVFTEAERYFIYLRVKQYDRETGSNLKNFCWTEEIREIVKEFDPDYQFLGRGEQE